MNNSTNKNTIIESSKIYIICYDTYDIEDINIDWNLQIFTKLQDAQESLKTIYNLNLPSNHYGYHIKAYIKINNRYIITGEEYYNNM